MRVLRPRPHARAARAHAADLEPARLARHGRAGGGPARGRRLRGLGAPRLRSLLGIPGGLVELDQQLRGRGGIPRAVRRLLRSTGGPTCRARRAGWWRWSSWPALTGLNLAGVRVTGRSAVVLGAGALLPVAVFTVVAGLVARSSAPWTPFAADEGSLVGGLGLGLAVMMWNYSGLGQSQHPAWARRRRPRTAYRRAMLLALPLIALAYLLPVAAGLAVSGDWDKWEHGPLPQVAEAVGGWRLAEPGDGGRAALHRRALPLGASHELAAALRARQPGAAPRVARLGGRAAPARPGWRWCCRASATAPSRSSPSRS